MATYTYKPGLGQSAAYQVSGKPFASGSINCQTAGRATAVNFPNVTQWVMFTNHSTTQTCRVGFSSNAVMGSGATPNNFSFFVLPAATTNGGPVTFGPINLKLTQVWLTGSSNVDVIAGLTYIDSTDINNINVSPNGLNWSGSTGAQVG